MRAIFHKQHFNRHITNYGLYDNKISIGSHLLSVKALILETLQLLEDVDNR